MANSGWIIWGKCR